MDATREVREKRDLVLAPGTYAYMQDATKGQIRVYTGPTVINQTAQDMPCSYDPQNGQFTRCGLEEAVRQAPIAPEGYYLILDNPATQNEHPDEGTGRPSPQLEIGRTINTPGPCTFSLWPGQSAHVVRGHHLRSNAYLLVRVYNEDEARKNWSKAVVKPASGPTPGDDAAPPTTTATTVPTDLTVGKLYVIKGTEVSFYIPPTGVQVVPEEADRYVRDALTLERLEYCILIDENGKKRYEKGPQVVFPKPTEAFVVDKHGTRKFRAVELNPIQGLHVKTIAPYKDEKGVDHKEGEELFITGADTQIYFPREEHSLITYDGKSKHYATAIPAGEARYVLDRMTGNVKLVRGPAMLLCDPRREVIARRSLSDKQCSLWYPDNTEALEYNRSLRELLANVPTTRQGVVSEGEYARSVSNASKANPGAARAAVAYAASNALMEHSLINAPNAGMVADEFSRASTYTAPRTVTLDTKYQGAPSIDVWTGYAVKVVSKTGKRRVEKGPATIIMEYDESLEVLELSTGKPKSTDNLLRTVYLRVDNNKVADIVQVETADHVVVNIKLSYRVNFEDTHKDKWFDVENYIKFLCDHVRSVLKGAARKYKVEEFYAGSTEIIRDTVLGKSADGTRQGMFFEENGMRCVDVEVLKVEIGDESIAKMLNTVQHEVVQSNIQVFQAQRRLDFTIKQEEINRGIAEAQAETTKRKLQLQAEQVGQNLNLKVTEIAAELKQEAERKTLEVAVAETKAVANRATLQRNLETAEQQEKIELAAQERKLAALKAETDTVVERFKAAQPGFAEAILAASSQETVVKIAEAWNIQRVIGGESLADALQKVFQGTPLGDIVKKLAGRTQTGANGNGERPQPATR